MSCDYYAIHIYLLMQSELLRSQLKQQVDENDKLANALKDCQHYVTKTVRDKHVQCA